MPNLPAELLPQKTGSPAVRGNGDRRVPDSVALFVG